MHYLDASCCVAILTPESGTGRASAWLAAHRDEPFSVSLWVHVEVASALAMKVRTGSLNEEQRAAALAGWLSMRRSCRILGIPAGHFAAAAQMVERSELGLRAGDALHLAVAAAHGCTLVTLDDRMAKAAPKVGVPVAAI
jgi:predicted nucleic acid-binding protein